MLSKLRKQCGNGSPRKFADAVGRWRKLTFGEPSLETAILDKYRSKNSGSRSCIETLLRPSGALPFFTAVSPHAAFTLLPFSISRI